MTRSRSLFAAAVGLVATGMLLWSAVPGSAVAREGFTVSKEEPFEGEYPAMGPGAPSGAEGNLTTPASCAGAARVDCDVIKFEVIVPPEVDDDKDVFFTVIELSWDDAGGSNDLDLYLWDNGQNTGTQTEIASHATADNPQTAKIANPDLGEYNIVVENFAGANTGYTIRAIVTTDPFENPVESLAPEPPKPEPEEGPEEEPEAPEDLSGDEPPPPPGPGPDPTLPPVDAGSDEAFDFGFSDLDDRITVNVDEFGGPGGEQASAPRGADSVSPAVLLASLVGAPALLVGSGAAVVWRRRKTLTF